MTTLRLEVYFDSKEGPIGCCFLVNGRIASMHCAKVECEQKPSSLNFPSVALGVGIFEMHLNKSTHYPMQSS
jgi:hypothetical protein